MCSACEADAEVIVCGYDLCHTHGKGIMIAVLTGDYTPVGYILAASIGEVSEMPRVSTPETLTPVRRISGFMRHGVIAAPPQPRGASPKSGCPQPLRAQAFA